MPTYVLSTVEKKNIEERMYWAKNGQIICRIEWYRWGTWYTESDTKPEIDLDNPHGYEIYTSDVEWELDDMIDGVAVWWEWPDEMDEDERSRIEELFNEEGFSGLEEHGWDHSDTERFLHGPLELTCQEHN